MQSIDQQELIRNLKKGHETSFTVLYNTYGEKIYRLAYRMVGNKEEAEDITQETFLQVYRNIERFNEESQLYTWIYRITKNLCYRVFQRQKKTSFASLEALIYTAQNQEIPADITTLERQYLINQIKEGCLTGLLRCLSFYQRVAFILHVLVHLSIQDVAEILDKSQGATKVLIHRARQNLKRFLCKHCSLYNQANPCRCESLLGFSLKQGWITKPSQGELDEFTSMNTRRIEAEIKSLRKITELYTSLSEQNPPEDLSHRIQTLIRSQKWSIFSDKKV
jgi:RNA polymerase sigma-70 factor (ECF subfamily)